ncbi:hypothetical protein CA13_36540 [Planctomycetes bacterium CA13]|uniref:Uncharacterized protein n=1 Tax=Novipirellula herctigrandis TaxID=2527986 RepID=A0A5C5Z6P1_9BACT|nr:hypothetical protein CA13_36540 [Planctomycetes bacterium CA13]
MVQIQPPSGEVDGSLPAAAGQVAVGNSNVDSEQITRDAMSAVDIDSPDNTADSHVPPTAFQGAEIVAAETIEDVAPPIAGEGWQSDQTRKSRQIALVVAVSIASLLTAAVVFVWFVRSRNPKADIAQGDDTAQVATDAGPENDTHPGEMGGTGEDGISRKGIATDPTAVALLPETPEVVEVQPDAGNGDPGNGDPGNGDPGNVQPNAGELTTPQTHGMVTDATETPPSTEKLPPSIIPADLLPKDPLASDADLPMNQPPVIASPETPPATDNESPSPSLQQLPPGLAKFTQLLDLGGDANEVKPTIEAPPTLAPVALDAPAEESIDPMMIATPPPTINTKRSLAIPFAFDSKGYPLGDMVLLLSQITGVPIQLDWVSLDIAGYDIANRVVPERGFLSAKEHVEKICESFQGEMRIEESLIVLTVADDAFSQRSDTITEMADFGEGRSSAISVVNTFLSEPDGEDATELPVSDLRPEQQLKLLAVDSLRRMRGIEPKIDDAHFLRWAHPADAAQSQWPVLSGGDSVPTLDAPITIGGLLRRVSRKNGATCVVNWFDANRRQMSPEQLMMTYAKDDAGQLFERILAPFEVQVRTVDKHYWWVGTEASYDRLSAIVWTEPLGENRQAFLSNIHEKMAGQTRDVFRIAYDQQSDRVLMMLPRFIVRQLPKFQPALANNSADGRLPRP